MPIHKPGRHFGNLFDEIAVFLAEKRGQITDRHLDDRLDTLELADPLRGQHGRTRSEAPAARSPTRCTDDQLHLIAELDHFLRPTMRAAAGFHHHHSRGQLCHELSELGPGQLFAELHCPDINAPWI